MTAGCRRALSSIETGVSRPPEKPVPDQPGELVGAPEGQEILRTFDWFLKAAKELLQIFVALDEIDFGRINNEEIGAFIAEKEMLIGAGYLFNVFG